MVSATSRSETSAASSAAMSDTSSNSSPAGSPLGSPRVVTNPPPASQIQLINIKSHIPTVLDLHEANYGLWRQMFLVVLTKFGLLDHIDGSKARGDSDWVQNDFAIVSWIYLTISNEILRIVQTRKDTAHSLWRAVRSLFLDNAEARSIYLSAEFRNLYQGDMTVLAYCTRMKELADMLGDLGAPVEERDLVLNILRGLNPRLHGIIPALTMHPPLPDFIKVRSNLQFEEHRLAQAERLVRHAAFLAQNSGPSPPAPGYFGVVASMPPSAPPSSAPPSSPSSSGGKKGKNTNRKKGSGSPSSNNARPTTSSSPGACPPNANMLAGMFQAWQLGRASPSGAGVLGAAPGAQPPQAYHAAPAPSPTQPSWDQASLVQALNAMSNQPSSSNNGDWYLDSGASSHMASQPGSANQGGDAPM